MLRRYAGDWLNQNIGRNYMLRSDEDSKPKAQPSDEPRILCVFAGCPCKVLGFTVLAHPFDTNVRSELAPDLIPQAQRRGYVGQPTRVHINERLLSGRKQT